MSSKNFYYYYCYCLLVVVKNSKFELLLSQKPSKHKNFNWFRVVNCAPRYKKSVERIKKLLDHPLLTFNVT